MAESRREHEGPPADSSGVLHSWKEIAAHLRRDVRTVQRWEKTEGLPVHRHWHQRLGSLYAYKAELDDWWRNHHEQIDAVDELDPSPDSAGATEPSPTDLRGAKPARPVLVIAGSAILLIALVATAWLRNNQPEGPRVVAAVQPLGSGRVLAKATSEGAQLRTIPVTGAPFRLALTPDGGTLYVGDQEDSTLSIVDVAAARVVDRVRLNGVANSIVVSPDGERVYVGLRNGDLDVMDARSKQVTHVVMGGSVTDMTLTADGGRLYLAMVRAGLKRLDTATLKATSLPAVPCPFSLALTPDQKRLYVNYQCGGPQGREGHDSIEVFDVATERSVATITGLPNVGGWIRVSPDGAHVWADGSDACGQARYDHEGCPVVPGSVANVIRTADNKWLRPVGAPPGEAGSGFAFSPDGSRLIWAGEVTRVLNTVNFSTLERLPLHVSSPPVFAPNGRRVFLSLGLQSAVAVLEVAEDKCTPPAAATPRAWWPADGTADDMLGAGKGEIEEGVLFGAGRLGQAFSFHGFGGAARLYPGDYREPFTIAFWVRFQELPETSVVEKAPPAGTNAEGWRLSRAADGRLRLCLTSGLHEGCAGNSALSSAPLQDHVWHHVAVVRNGEVWALYVNGRQTGAARLGEFKHYFAAPVRVGSRMLGAVDEFQIFDRALAAADITAVYQYGRCLADEP